MQLITLTAWNKAKSKNVDEQYYPVLISTDQIVIVDPITFSENTPYNSEMVVKLISGGGPFVIKLKETQAEIIKICDAASAKAVAMAMVPPITPA